MFENDSYVAYETDEGRHVFHIVNQANNQYLVEIPMFTHFGCVFARWKPEVRTQHYIDRKCIQLEPEVADRYRCIKRGDDADILFA